MERFDGRADDALRPIRFQRGFTESSEGSVLVHFGRTRVLCTVSAVPGVPNFQLNKKEGWLTAEYAMLPGSVEGRKPREYQRRDGRSVEIQRLIGRALRSVLDLSAFPNWTLYVDCDVVQADGGTRCAALTGSCVALHDALRVMAGRNQVGHWPLRDWLAAVSVAHVAGRVVLDPDYAEDFEAGVDMNVVASGGGRIVEVQSTSEGEPIPRELFTEMLDLGLRGVAELVAMQKAAVEEPLQV